MAILNYALIGAVGALALLSLVIYAKQGVARSLWTAKFVGILALMAILWFTARDGTGWVGLAAWLLLVQAPMFALGRVVRSLLYDDYDAAAAWARIPPWLHPADGMTHQPEVVEIARLVDHGEVEQGLERAKALHARAPDAGFYVPADEARARGAWDEVRRLLEADATPAALATSTRHTIPYLLALGETGDLPALVDTYGLAAPLLRRLKSWKLDAFARAIVCAALGMRDELERILTRELPGMKDEAAALFRATARMADGDVDGGREALRARREHATFANRLFIDRRLAQDPAPVDPALRERARALFAPFRRPLWARIVRAAAVAMIAAFLLVYMAPWRTMSAPNADGSTFGYIEKLVGTDDETVALPLVIVLHGHDSMPELMLDLIDELERPARLVFPAAPARQLLWHSWYRFEPDDVRADDIRWGADALVEFAQTLARDVPTRGRPIVTGFSQGGALSFAIAARHPDAIEAAFPVGGVLDGGINARAPEATPPTVLALHGEDDETLTVNHARDGTERLARAGIPAHLETFPDLGHTTNDALRGALVDAIRDVIDALAP